MLFRAVVLVVKRRGVGSWAKHGDAVGVGAVAEVVAVVGGEGEIGQTGEE